MDKQLPLFPQLLHQFPSTRYQGSKAKLADWIWEQIQALNFSTCLDAFGGTGAMAYRLKDAGKAVTYNDILRFNYHIGRALIENSHIQLNESLLDTLLNHSQRPAKTVISQHFQDIYFTDEENQWIDSIVGQIQQLTQPYQQSLAFFALSQACLVKRPYNLFHRKNLYLRFAEVERSFGNKSSWDKPFEQWFRQFVQEANQAVFDNGQVNQALNQECLEISANYDLVYIDPPYMSQKGVAVDYRDFYHFLEGLVNYEVWEAEIDYQSKHRRLKPRANRWTDKKQIYQAFDALFAHFAESILVVSYRSDGIPSELELSALLKRYKARVEIIYYGHYQYALSTNKQSQEILLIGY